ncbi:MAG: hypothetical protein ACPGRG_10860 [Marinomonas sp.]|jgi:hypothetical protein|uniref:VanZ family protein n=1 Tax=Marinomonas pontica TaxID=264739 RepID=A0ABN6WKJ4_9GAMM|nr:hypothetical protein [Marinomonas pontica]MCW8356452.1 hypothetical protein [Marinomonas pontica]BDX02417.1 hypothetical protein MACH16_11650 [Marinomonas pontica]
MFTRLPTSFWFTPTAQAVGFIIGAVIILVATLTPAAQLPPVPGTDKLHHIIGFGGWALLCAFGPLKRFLSLAMLIILLGGVVEIIQPYVNRHGEWLDFYADAFGVFIVVIIKLGAWIFSKRTQRMDESLKKT